MYAHVAIHYPAADRFDEVARSIESVLEEIVDAEGFHRSYVGTDPDRTQVFAVTFWDEPHQFDDVLPIVQAAVDEKGLRRGELRAPEVIRLSEAV